MNLNPTYVTCPGCNGEGVHSSGHQCSQCEGSGKVPKWWLANIREGK